MLWKSGGELRGGSWKRVCELVFGEGRIAVSIDRLIRSRRKTVALIVEGDGSLTVRAPLAMPEEAIGKFVEQHADWVRKHQQQAQKNVPPPARRYQEGEEFLFQGKSFPLKIVSHQPTALIFDGKEFRLLRSALPRAQEVFEQWYKAMASPVIFLRLSALAKQYGFRYRRVCLSSARTRWGSCSSRGTLRFSWRLVMAPSEIIDYVLVHELVHTKIPCHSPEFWALVEKILPDYRQRRAWLQRTGRNLTL